MLFLLFKVDLDVNRVNWKFRPRPTSPLFYYYWIFQSANFTSKSAKPTVNVNVSIYYHMKVKLVNKKAVVLKLVCDTLTINVLEKNKK